MAMYTDVKEANLPKWAQERLAGYRRKVDSLASELMALKEGTEKAAFFIEHWEHRGRFYLPHRTGRLQYQGPTGCMELREDDKLRELKVYALDGTLTISPESSNVVRLAVTAR